MGLFVGSATTPEHTELDWFQAIHDEYLHETGSFWYRPQQLIEYLGTSTGKRHCAEYIRRKVHGRFGRRIGFWRHFGGVPMGVLLACGWPTAWGWKEPRTTLFADVWLEVFPGMKVIHVVRHPLDVAMSIQKRELDARQLGAPPQPGLEDLNYCVRLVGLYVQAGLRLSHLGDRYLEIRFEDVQESPTEELAKLAAFCGLALSQGRLRRAVSQIDRERRSRWRQLPKDVARDLMISFPFSDRWGYWPLGSDGSNR